MVEGRIAANWYVIDDVPGYCSNNCSKRVMGVVTTQFVAMLVHGREKTAPLRSNKLVFAKASSLESLHFILKYIDLPDKFNQNLVQDQG